MTTFDADRPGPRQLSKRDWTIIVCGTLVLVASFLPWEAASANGLGTSYSASDSAWSAGFGAWFGSLLCAAAAAAVAARHLGYAVGIRGIGPNLAACGLAAAGAALVVIRLLTLPRGSGYTTLGTNAGGYGPSFGAYAGVGLAIVEVIVALLNVRASGERLPSGIGTGRSRPGLAPAGPPMTSTPMSPPMTPAPMGPPMASTPMGPPMTPAPSGAGMTSAAGGPGVTVPVPVPHHPVSAAPGTGRPYPDDELAQRLSRLDSLRSGGLISEREYQEQRGRIINQL
jgi:hypothetical protein